MRKHEETKTRKSRRTIALPKQVVDVLEERWSRQKQTQKQERVGHGSQATTEAAYRKQLRPVITGGAETVGEIVAGGDAEADTLGGDPSPSALRHERDR
ncbi:hypothetical protein GFH48_19320 [Streptomyces fagopyri]|uniref:Uncharacterized protein n=1 Tax=Streptomyces fagopyri TaxID=2662397 RepID=A0A5Q0LDK9_9ACTN|nr:hypothetical protein [Streptomyces fagopyri]QFZ75133.1 hypothetical protein GFH48_19320 [Streptomyces fagopyri]